MRLLTGTVELSPRTRTGGGVTVPMTEPRPTKKKIPHSLSQLSNHWTTLTPVTVNPEDWDGVP